jgi:hypothetical protein
VKVRKNQTTQHRLHGRSAWIWLGLWLSVGIVSSSQATITIGSGPWIGTDTAGNSYNEEFQDWEYDDVRALDGAGSAVGGRYNFGDSYDDSRDLIAFYSRHENGVWYFRADFYDLKLGAESGNLDLYVAIDCALGGQPWMPNYTDVQVDPAHPWEVCIGLYDTVNHDIFLQDWSTTTGLVGAYYHSELDAVEFGIDDQVLFNAGWNGSSTIYFTVMTAKDLTDIPNCSDATDTFFDDDRGCSDGVINGAIASDAHTGRAKYASIAHGNQSINKADDLRVHIYDPPTVNKTGFIRTLDTHEIFNVPINLHLSGSLIIASNWAEAPPGDDPLTDGPAFLQRVGQFINADQNDGQPGALIGGVMAEHIMPYFEGEVNAESIGLFNELIDEIWSLAPGAVKVMHTPERVIRSDSTGLSPLDGHTFEDIEASSYTATYIDEVTHLHWWFYPLDGWSGAHGGYDAPHHHKIHLINGVYCFAINDREDQAKFGPHNGGMALDTRFTLVDKASQADQTQLTLIFDDWEALAGKSFDPVQGISLENNNQWQYQQTIRWAANHPWIEIVTLEDILDRATNPGNPQYDASWVIDTGYNFNLSIQTYEWLKHASEDSYNYWYYNQNAGFGGNEQNFYNLVPVITGQQGDYQSRFGGTITSDAAANAVDGPKLPSGKIHGDLNSVGSLMHDAWNAIHLGPAGRLQRLATLAFVNLIYETAWHEEDYGATQHYQGTQFGNPWPVPDPTWDGVNTWALRLQNHVRSTGITMAAADWAADVAANLVTPETIATAVDLDFDGQDEYVLSNNRVFVVFERWGGRLTHGYTFHHDLFDGMQIIGTPVSNPSEPGEEERLGTSANRASGFKEMNPAYVDADFTVSLGGDSLTLTSPDGLLSKTIQLADGSATLAADYSNSTGGNHYVRVGLSPQTLDLAFTGRSNLQTHSQPSYYELRNTNGGFGRIIYGSGVLNTTPADAGYENRNLALVEQVELFGGASFAFGVQIGTSMFDLDRDGDVDRADLNAMNLCLTGPLPVANGCPATERLADWDGNLAVDISDFAEMQPLITGSL